MTVRANPRGLHRPFRGGSPGSTVTVEPLLCGEARVPPGFLEEEPGPLKWFRYAGIGVGRSRWRWIPIPAFLITHPTAGRMLVDTGMHPSVATDPAANLGRLVARFGEVRLPPEQVLVRQLRDRGIGPEDIRVVLLTHLHFDHASGISQFPGSTFVCSESEWTAATTVSRPILHGYRRELFDYAFEYRTIDFRRGAIASWSTFGRTFDLFDDQSVRLAFTPGHTEGHVSVICRLRDRELVIAGDAVYTHGQLDEAPEPPRPEDAHEWRRSARELSRHREQHPDSVIVAGQDPEQWASLPERFE
ncbi:MAG: N-acyl homoserine lactonase family protein [Solirubrobacterales bacterium]